MGSVCRVEVKQGNSTIYTPAKITCGQKVFPIPSVLLDTGANICHMTYPMWLHIGYGEACYKNNPTAFHQNNIHSISDISFENLPLISDVSIIGGGLEAKIYRFRIERLELREKIKGSSNAIVLENITTHLIDGDEPEFLIGWNVLKYLKTTYTPALPFDLSQQDSDMVISNYYHLELTKEGRILLEYDRHLQFNNDLKEMFEY